MLKGTHKLHILTDEDAPFCMNISLSKHFLFECHDLAQVCDRNYKVNSFSELFDTVPSKTFIDHLKEINQQYSKI
jgi:hypothetical protein